MGIQQETRKEERDRQNQRILFTKLQQHFKRLGRPPNPEQEARIKKGLSQLVFAVETPNLIDRSTAKSRAQQQRRLKTEIKTNRPPNRPVLDHGKKVIVIDDDGGGVDCCNTKKVKESGDHEFNYISPELSDIGSQGLINSHDLELMQPSIVFTNQFSIDTIGDKKYSRDEIFEFSSTEEVCLEFS
ncbi:OLC1v1010707C1 [Oldenlandia corymbosa var. corymbosa]|uniref:OLC1v1010707C1 n=1 Tax=Oldenlandia corymbosa var. corymbosa TaxID=529605 RepID=A0AAV1DRZ4_OLDCO|nr:OLC1v1010707C1 [Oldenlandia corymbosa var. corymbosa]